MERHKPPLFLFDDLFDHPGDTPSDSEAKQILIAEDEPAIRHLLQKLLNHWGYRTLVAHDGKQAIEVAGQHPGDIDLLLSDVTMPEMGGQELAEFGGV